MDSFHNQKVLGDEIKFGMRVSEKYSAAFATKGKGLSGQPQSLNIKRLFAVQINRKIKKEFRASFEVGPLHATALRICDFRLWCLVAVAR
jgi:hypothetical protein